MENIIENILIQPTLTLTPQERKALTEMFNSIYYPDSEHPQSEIYKQSLSPTLQINIHKYLLNTLSYKDLPDTIYDALGFDEFAKMKTYPEELPSPMLGREYVEIYRKVLEIKGINLDEIDGDKIVEDLIEELNIEGKENNVVDNVVDNVNENDIND